MRENNINSTWTPEEDNIIKQYYPIEGAKIVTRLPGRKQDCKHTEDVISDDTTLTKE